MGGEKGASPIPLIHVLDHPNSSPTLGIRKQLNGLQLSLMLRHTVVYIPGDLLSVSKQNYHHRACIKLGASDTGLPAKRGVCLHSPQTASAFFSLPFLS